MKITYDFDVVTDAPAPKRRAPEPAEQAAQTDADGERRRCPDAPPPEPRPSVQAAE
jgi:hypothetical protein